MTVSSALRASSGVGEPGELIVGETVAEFDLGNGGGCIDVLMSGLL